MRTYHAAKSQTQVSNGLVCLVARFETDAEVFTCYSPAAARYVARLLLQCADEAEGWQPPDAEDLRREAAEAELDAKGVARVEGPPKKKKRKKDSP